jgi:hypothetical protein
MSLSNISAAHLFGSEFEKVMEKETLRKKKKEIKSRDDSHLPRS